MTGDPLQARLCLALLALPRVGPKTALRVLRVLGAAPASADELLGMLASAPVPGKPLPQFKLDDARRAYRSADEILECCGESQIEVLPHGSARLPASFWSIPDPAVVVYLRGRSEFLIQQPSVAIVGTRHPTDYGAEAARKFGFASATEGFAVVSGLALGCDAAGHGGCLEASGLTAAVLAHGLDTVYPSKHRALARRILDAGGALLSEYPPGTSPRPNQFVERDRLQSALSSAVIVIETDLDGGTMHTVGFAKSQQRLIACLSHPDEFLDRPSTRGNRMLIAEGARPVADTAQLLAFLAYARAAPPDGDTGTAGESFPDTLWSND